MKENIDCFDFRNKVVVVTGGTGSIGRVIVNKFIMHGAKVVATHKNKRDKANKGINEDNPYFCKVDVTIESDVKKCIKCIESKYGGIDILVISHGIQKRKSFLNFTIQEWNKIIETNLTGSFIVSKYIAKSMIKQKRKGKIIGITSLTSFAGIKYVASYAASKGGMESLLNTMAVELIGYGIRVNAVAPGRIDTNMTKDILKDRKSYNNIISRIPMNRFGKPEEIADAVMFLASEFSAYMNGHTIIVDGGWTSSIGNVNR